MSSRTVMRRAPAQREMGGLTTGTIGCFPLIACTFFVALVTGSTDLLAEDTLPSAEEMATIVERGREIAGYERAAIGATDLLLAGKPDYSRMDLYVAVHTDQRWRVYFGKLDDSGNRFLIAYAYACSDEVCQEIKSMPNSEPAHMDLPPLARAVKLASKSFEADSQLTYNTNVFREPDSSITVYVTPGSTTPETVLLGGDFKISISPDGTQVLKNVKLHNTVLRFSSSDIPEGARGVSALHSHVRSDLPTETDVAHVLLHPKELAPHIVIGQTFTSEIAADGHITVKRREPVVNHQDRGS